VGVPILIQRRSVSANTPEIMAFGPFVAGDVVRRFAISSSRTVAGAVNHDFTIAVFSSPPGDETAFLAAGTFLTRGETNSRIIRFRRGQENVPFEFFTYHRFVSPHLWVAVLVESSAASDWLCSLEIVPLQV